MNTLLYTLSLPIRLFPQILWWKDYAKMQEDAFERRDAILEKMKQEQDSRAVQIRMREKSTTRRETALVSEEARQLRENATLEAAKTALRKDQHALKLKQHTTYTKVIKCSFRFT